MKQKIWYLLLLPVVWGLYGFLLSGWWYSDDTEIIAFAAAHSPAGYLSDPQIWQSFSPFNLVPWILLSLKIDVMLAGFTPYFYYLHQIMALSVVALALFAVLNLYVGQKIFSVAGVLIFLLHPATLAVASWISTRQYLEGLGFGLFGAYCFVKGIRNNRRMLIFISALFYAIASMAKEVYVPLPLLLILLPEKDIKARIKHALPLFAVTGLYVIYRSWMLGNNTLGGYSEIWPWTFRSAMLSAPKIFQAYGGSWWLILTVSAVMLFWTLKGDGALKNRTREMARGAFIFLILYLPIIPVSPLWGGLASLRYFLLTSLFITFCYVFCLDHLFGRGSKLRDALLIVSLLFTIAGFYHGFKGQKAIWDSEKAQAYGEGMFFLENSKSRDVLFKTGQPHWFFDGLEKIETMRSGNTEKRKIRLVSGDFYGIHSYLQGSQPEPREAFGYDPGKRAVMDMTETAVKAHEAFLKTLRDKPLRVDISVRDGVFKLDLGPYEGQYVLLEASPEQPDHYYLAVVINKRFGIKLTHREKVRIFCLAYTSPEGWTTVSPGFLVDRSNDQAIRWVRADIY